MISTDELMKQGKAVAEGTTDAESLAEKFKVEVQFINDQITKGMEIEAEHSSDPDIQRKIALDHLTETPNYYVNWDFKEKLLAGGSVDEVKKLASGGDVKDKGEVSVSSDEVNDEPSVSEDDEEELSESLKRIMSGESFRSVVGLKK